MLGAVLGAVVGLALAPAVAVASDRLPMRAGLGPPWTVTFPLRSSMLSVVVLAAIGARIRIDSALPAYLFLGGVGSALAVIDMRCRRLPDALTLPSYPILGALIAFASFFHGPGGHALVRAALAGVIFFAIFFAMWLVRPSDLGFGDVKLSGLLGVCLGWLGWGSWFVGLMAGFFIGGFISVLLLLARRVGRKDHVPYGPFMLGGALVGVLWGASLASSYVGAHVG